MLSAPLVLRLHQAHDRSIDDLRNQLLTRSPWEKRLLNQQRRDAMRRCPERLHHQIQIAFWKLTRGDAVADSSFQSFVGLVWGRSAIAVGTLEDKCKSVVVRVLQAKLHIRPHAALEALDRILT